MAAWHVRESATQTETPVPGHARPPGTRMRLKYLVLLIAYSVFVLLHAVQNGSLFRCRVDLVGVSFVVTDDSGRYISGLRPDDLRVFQDGRQQNIRSFLDANTAAPDDDKAAASIYILFDT